MRGGDDDHAWCIFNSIIVLTYYVNARAVTSTKTFRVGTTSRRSRGARSHRRVRATAGLRCSSSGKPVMKKSAIMAAAPPAMGAIQAIQWRSQRTFVETTAGSGAPLDSNSPGDGGRETPGCVDHTAADVAGEHEGDEVRKTDEDGGKERALLQRRVRCLDDGRGTAISRFASAKRCGRRSCRPRPLGGADVAKRASFEPVSQMHVQHTPMSAPASWDTTLATICSTVIFPSP